MSSVRMPSLGPRSRGVLVANDRDVAQLHHASKHMGSNIGTAGVIAEVFGEQFVAAVRSLEARLDYHVRNGECPPTESIRLSNVEKSVWK